MAIPDFQSVMRPVLATVQEKTIVEHVLLRALSKADTMIPVRGWR